MRSLISAAASPTPAPVHPTHFMSQVSARKGMISLVRGEARPSPALYQFQLWGAHAGALERKSATSDILVRFTKLSSRARFLALFRNSGASGCVLRSE